MKNVLFTLILAAILPLLFISESSAQSPSKQIPAAQWYEGGQEAMYKFINDNKIYPPIAKRNRIQGECIATIYIEADGTVKGGVITKDIGAGCGTESLRLLKLLKFKPIGYKVDVNVPVYFKLQFYIY